MTDMAKIRQKEDGEHARSGFRVTFSGADTFFATVKGSEKLSIPEALVLRCGLLADIRDQGDHSQHEVGIELPMSDAKSWLKCAKVGKSEELFTQPHAILLGALKVSNPMQQKFLLTVILCWNCSSLVVASLGPLMLSGFGSYLAHSSLQYYVNLEIL